MRVDTLHCIFLNEEGTLNIHLICWYTYKNLSKQMRKLWTLNRYEDMLIYINLSKDAQLSSSETGIQNLV